MKWLTTILFSAFACCNFFVANAQYITVDDSKTAQQLVEDILVNSSCANVSNFTVKGDSFSGSSNSYGYFNSGTGNFPFTEGVLLSTWSSTNSVGPFVSNRGGGDESWDGDADLDQTLGIQSVNATSLEFDFTPLTNFISFNYIFTSNEYQAYFPCEYSDGFAFLIKEKGSADNYKNLAVLPNSSTPVSSENVHPLINNFTETNGVIHLGCPPINQEYFNGFNTNTSPINYSGQTKVLTAQTEVIVGKTYHIKLVIADDKEEYYDSAVFLEAGSFVSNINLGEDRLLSSNNPICFGESYSIDTNLPAGYTYKWFKNDVEIPSATRSSYQINDSGTYKVEVLLSAGCTATEEIKIEYAPEIPLDDATLVQCDDNNDNIAVFNLTKMDGVIKKGATDLSIVEYYESLTNAQGQINPIVNPSAYINTTPNQILVARVTNSYGCANFSQLTLTIINNVIATQPPVSTCDNDDTQDGLHQFDLDAQVSQQILSGLPSGILVEYYLNESDAVSEKNPLPNLFTTTIANQQTIFARLINGTDCYSINPVRLQVNIFDPPNFEDETAILCNGSSISLNVDSGYSSYLWNTGSISNTLIVTSPGEYSVKVTDSNGCEKTKKYTVKSSDIATITRVVINDFAENENSVLIEYTGIGNYEFSLDGFYFQDNSLFNNVVAGKYFAYVRDKNGCGLSAPYTLYVMDYPKYFTPNGDGYNDLWEIKNLDLFPNSVLFIFDRYGKLIKQVTNSEIGWNGTFGGTQMPADDYWFTLKLADGRESKGHFSLKR